MSEWSVSDTPFERIDPAQVSEQSFAATRRGFDQKQVKAYLVSVSNQIAAGQQQIRDLREQAAQAVEQVEAETAFSPQGVKLLDGGVEASRRLVQTEADEMASRARHLADELQTTVEGLRAHSEPAVGQDVADLLEQACGQAQAVAGLLQEARDQAEAEVEQGRDQGRQIVEQAKTLRLAVLRDMARRRQTARAQIERLRAGRDKLLTTLGDARKSIDLSMEAAKMSLAEAKIAADAAARRVEDEAAPSDNVLLSELHDAETVGMISEAEPAVQDEAQAETHPVAAPVGESTFPPSRAEAPEADPEAVVGEVEEGVTLLPREQQDPLDGAAVHPALASAPDSPTVEAVFARLRSESD